MPLEPDGLTVFVGPNGSGKTNLFRVVKKLTRVLAATSPMPSPMPSQDLEEVLAVLPVWQRDPTRPAVLEIGLKWDSTDEKEMLVGFLRSAMIQAHLVAEGLGLGHDQALWYRPAWRRFASALPQLIGLSETRFLFQGTLGLKFWARNHFFLYYTPSSWRKFTWGLPPSHAGVIPMTLPRAVPSGGAPGFPLPQFWARSLPPSEREMLSAYLKTPDGDEVSGPPPLSFSFHDVLQSVAEQARQLPSPPGWTLDVGVDHQAQPEDLVRAFRERIFGTEPMQPGVTIRLGSVLNHLLTGRAVLSDDLFSPPTEEFDADSWWRSASPLTSVNLGPHLTALRLGNDADRARYSAIQQTFKRLSGRDLDLTMRKWPPGESGRQVSIQLLQRGTGDRQSTPLAESGSGLVDLAYVATILNQSESHVVLLDEPGRALHPQALLALGRFVNDRQQAPSWSQTLLITHSPYLVPTATLERVRRLYRDADGLTQVARLGPPFRRRSRERRSRQDQKRQDRWGRSVNWPALLFSTVVLIVEGETELGALPIWYEKQYTEPLEAIGVTVLCVGGKPQVGEAIRELDSFSIPWVVLVDGDSLKKGKDHSGNIWDELVEGKRIKTTAEAQRLKDLEFSKQVHHLKSSFPIFVCGEKEDEEFEAILKRSFPEAAPPPGMACSKVLTGRWYAQEYLSPAFLEPLFETLREIAHGTTVGRRGRHKGWAP